MGRTGSASTAQAPDRKMFANDTDYQNASRVYSENPGFYSAAVTGDMSGLSGLGKLVGGVFTNTPWARAVKNYQPTPTAPATPTAPLQVPDARQPVGWSEQPVATAMPVKPVATQWTAPMEAKTRKNTWLDNQNNDAGTQNAWTFGLSPSPFGGGR